MKNFFTLVPTRVQFEQFWIEIGKRNIWLIKLRYAAVGMLLSLIVGIYFLEYIDAGFSIKELPLILITISILFYNLIFQFFI